MSEPDRAASRTSLGWAFFLSIMTSGGMAALSLVTGVLTARLLGTDGRGQVAAISTWLITLTWASSWGFAHALTFYHSKRQADAGTTLATTLISIPILGLVGVLVAQTLIPIGFSAQTQETQDLARYFLCGIPFVLGVESAWKLLMAYHRFDFLNVTRIGQPAVYAVALVALAVSGHFTVRGVLGAQVGSYAVVFVATAVILVRSVRPHLPTLALVRKCLGYGLRLQGVALGQLVTARLDLMMLPAFVAAAGVGYYSIAVNVTSLVMSVFGSLSMVVFPVASRGEAGEMAQVVESGLRLALVGGTILVVGIGVTAPWLVPFVYGADFSGAVLPLWLLLPGVLLWCANTILSSGLEALDMPGRASLAQVVGIVATVAGLAVTLPLWGILGAAFTSSVTYGLVFLISLHLLRREGRVSLRATLSPTLIRRDVVQLIGRLADRLKRGRNDATSELGFTGTDVAPPATSPNATAGEAAEGDSADSRGTVEPPIVTEPEPLEALPPASPLRPDLEDTVIIPSLPGEPPARAQQIPGASEEAPPQGRQGRHRAPSGLPETVGRLADSPWLFPAVVTWCVAAAIGMLAIGAGSDATSSAVVFGVLGAILLVPVLARGQREQAWAPPPGLVESRTGRREAARRRTSGAASPRSWHYVLLALCCALIVAGVIVLTGGAINPLYLALAAGAVAAVACMVVATARFDLFVLGLLSFRPLLDGFISENGGGFSPATAVGLVFIAASGIWLLYRMRRGTFHRPSIATITTGSLVVAALLSCLVSHYPTASFTDTLRLLTAWLMFADVEQLLKDDDAFYGRLIGAVGLAVGLVTAWSLFGIVTHTAFFDSDSGLFRANGPFVHPNVLAKFLTIGVMLVAGLALHAAGRRRLLLWLGLAPVLLALGLSYARVGWIASIVGVFYLLYRVNWRLIPPLIGGAVLAVFTVPALYARISDLWAPPPSVGAPENSLVWRFDYWRELIHIVRTSPINGKGLNTIPIIGSQKGLNAHNVWVQTYVEMGLFGLVCLISAVVGILIALRTNQARLPTVRHEIAVAVALSILATTLTENLLNETTTIWYAAALMVIGWCPPREDGDPQEGYIPEKATRTMEYPTSATFE